MKSSTHIDEIDRPILPRVILARTRLARGLLAASILAGTLAGADHAFAQDVVIRGATVHTASPRGTLKNTDVVVHGGIIIAIGTGAAQLPRERLSSTPLERS